MNDYLSLQDADELAAETAEIANGPAFGQMLTGIIRHPAVMLKEVLAHHDTVHAVVLSAAGGIYWAVNFSIAQAIGESVPLATLLGSVVLGGALGGIAYLYALSILMYWSSDVLGGQPTRPKVRSLLAVAGIPGIIALLLFGIPRILLFGQSLFLPDRAWLDASPLLVWGLWFGDAVCFSWSLTLVVRGLKIMNGFTTTRAAVAAVLPAAPIVLIGILFVAIAWTGIFFAPPAF
ncbi:MAG: YIP1 family protein [Candidatus Polarisedimenticolia bacterium]